MDNGIEIIVNPNITDIKEVILLDVPSEDGGAIMMLGTEGSSVDDVCARVSKPVAYAIRKSGAYYFRGVFRHGDRSDYAFAAKES